MPSLFQVYRKATGDDWVTSKAVTLSPPRSTNRYSARTLQFPHVLGSAYSTPPPAVHPVAIREVDAGRIGSKGPAIITAAQKGKEGSAGTKANPALEGVGSGLAGNSEFAQLFFFAYANPAVP
jgi:hypothetical protein